MSVKQQAAVAVPGEPCPTCAQPVPLHRTSHAYFAAGRLACGGGSATIGMPRNGIAAVAIPPGAEAVHGPRAARTALVLETRAIYLTTAIEGMKRVSNPCKGCASNLAMALAGAVQDVERARASDDARNAKTACLDEARRTGVRPGAPATAVIGWKDPGVVAAENDAARKVDTRQAKADQRWSQAVAKVKAKKPKGKS